MGPPEISGKSWEIWKPNDRLDPLFWLEFRPCFGGLTFKNRGKIGVLGWCNIIANLERSFMSQSRYR